MEESKDYKKLLKNAYQNTDHDSFTKILDELIWLEWDKVPAIIQSFDFRKITRNIYYYYLFQSYFGDLSFSFFQFPAELFPPLTNFRQRWRADYQTVESFFKNLAKTQSKTFIMAVKSFFGIIRKSHSIYYDIADLYLGDITKNPRHTEKEVIQLIAYNYKLISSTIKRIDEIFKTDLQDFTKITDEPEYSVNSILFRHIADTLWEPLLSESESFYETLDFKAIDYEFTLKNLDTEFFHSTILWEMFIHGYFNAFISSLHITIPSAVLTTPFKICISLCEETPKMFASFIEYFAAKLETYSVMKI